MRGFGALLVGSAWIAAIASPACAQDAAVDEAARRGTELFWLDRAAWVTSDDIVARLPRERHSEVGGWIVVPAATGYHVYYHGKGSAADSIVYEADVVGNKVSDATIHPADAPPKLSGQATIMARALRTAWEEMGRHPDWRPCSPARFNTVVLPPRPDGAIPVYFLTPQTANDQFPFGGHFEVTIAPDGKVASSRRFTNSCLTLSKPASRGGDKPVGMALTHLLDAQPTEIHVFQQFPIGMPLYVGIASNKALWKVENGRMTLAKPPE